MDSILTQSLGPVKPASVPEQQHYSSGSTSLPFPLLLTPTTADLDAALWAKEHAEALDGLLNQHGALYFSGFPIDSADALNAFVESFPYPNFPYVGGNAVRTQLAPRVFTANEAPPSESIPFHHELAQTPSLPGKLFFSCAEPSPSGGETSIADSRQVLRRLRERFPKQMALFEENGVRYVRVLPQEDDPNSAIGRSWRSTYWTEEEAKVEEELKASGYSWEWLDLQGQRCLKTISPVLPAVRGDGENEAFVNQIFAAYTGWKDSRNEPEKAVVLGDMTPIPREFMNGLGQVLEELRVNIPWKKGDAMLVHNHLAMHARMPFVPPRKILASLCKD